MMNIFSIGNSIRSRIATVLTPRFSRLASLSIVSRQSDLRTYSAESSCETFSVGQSSPLAFPFKAKSQLAFSHQSVLPILLLFLSLFIGVGNAWGATATFTASDEGWTGTSTKNQTVSGVTFSFAGGTTNPTYYADGLRTYENCVITISSSNTITGIVFTYGVANNGYLKNFNTGTWTAGTKTWSGSATSINCTVGHNSGNKNGQVKITQIVVTYTPSATSHTLSSAVNPANSGTVTLGSTSVNEGSTTTATATPATHYTFTSWSISGTGASLSSTTANPTTVTMGTTNATVTANFTQVQKASITLSEAGTTTTDATTYYIGDQYTLPSTTEATCSGKVLVGWSTVEVDETNTKPSSNYYEKGAKVTLGGTQTFYAVFAKATPGEVVPHDGPSFSRTGSTDNVTSGYTFTTQASAQTDYYQDGSGTLRYIQLSRTTPLFSTTPVSITVTAKIGGGTGNTDLANPVYAQLINLSGETIGTAAVVTNHITTNNGDVYSNISIPTTDATSAYGFRIYHTKESGYNVRYYSMSLSYSTGGTTYSKYATTCCTPLGQINGADKVSRFLLSSYHYVKGRFNRF